MKWFVVDTETYVVDCSGSYAKCTNYMADRFLCNPKTAVLMCDPVEFLEEMKDYVLENKVSQSGDLLSYYFWKFKMKKENNSYYLETGD